MSMSLITLEDYAGPWGKSPDWTADRQDNAGDLLSRVNPLLDCMRADGVRVHGNPKTNTLVSGETYGGFRPQDCPIGAPGSSHKTGQAIDLFDPADTLDAWCMAHLDLLDQFGLYLEHPAATPTWCHLTTRAPKSGRRVFFP